MRKRKKTINGLPSYWMTHTEQSFSLLFLIFHRRKSQSEAARAEKSKSLWHLNNKAMLVYFLCKKSSVCKPLLWNTCHSPFYWTLLTPHFFLTSRSFHYQFLLHLQYWKWTGGDGKENTHTNTQHTHQMDSSDNKGDFNSWQAELRSVPTTDETSTSDSYW